MRPKTPWLVGLAATFIVLLIPAFAHAAAPVVKTVPWVATNPLIAHDTFPGKAVTLKGTADVQGAGITYRWQFGDGTPDATGTVSNMYAIEATHTYAGSTGTIFAATLTVTNTGTAESGSAVYLVQMRDKSLEIEVNLAIDEGLWYLHKNFYRYTSGTKLYGSWRDGVCGGGVCAGYDALQGANVNAFFVNGHRVDGADSNPYTETVQRAMRRLFDMIDYAATSSKTFTAGSYNPSITGTTDPDCTACLAGDPSDNNMLLYIAGSDVYQTGIVTAALAASGTPTAVADTGNATWVAGRTYRAILQDMVDYWVYAQEYRGTCSGFGGWRYSANYCSSDNSTAQWAAIAMLGAEGFGKGQYGITDPGIQIPTIVKTANKAWLKYSFRTFSGIYGDFGYDGPGSFAWGKWATTPSGMVQMAFTGIGRGGPDTKWDLTEKYIYDNWDNTGGAYYAIKDYYYGLYAFVKSMLLHVNEVSGVREPIVLFNNVVDWYASDKTSGGITDGVARLLVNDQSAAHWNGHYYSSEQTYFETSWAIQMLNRTITESGAPVAVAKAIPNPAVAGALVKLDGSGSFHQDPTKAIVKWEWDIGNDGVYELTGPIVNWTAPMVLGNYQVRLKVTDNFGTPATDDTVITVEVSIPPLAPTADAGGPYNFCPARTPWFLDASGSVNPDEGKHDPGCPACPGDTIATYAWDLNNDGVYEVANTKIPNVTAFFSGLGVGNYLVRLRVTDTTSLSFPGQPDLAGNDTTQVHVLNGSDPLCAGCTVVTIKGAGRQAQLTWTDVSAAGYAVYRGTVNGGPYAKVASVPGTQLLFIDGGLTTNTTYYWVVRPLAPNLDELCQSNQVTYKSLGR